MSWCNFKYCVCIICYSFYAPRWDYNKVYLTWFYNTKRITLIWLSEYRKRNFLWHAILLCQNSIMIIFSQISSYKSQIDTFLITPPVPHLVSSQILRQKEFLHNASVYWRRLSFKSRSVSHKHLLLFGWYCISNWSSCSYHNLNVWPLFLYISPQGEGTQTFACYILV